MQRWIPWLNLAFLPAYVALATFGTALGRANGVGQSSVSGPVWFWGFHVVCWLALVWLSRHVSRLMFLAALSIPVVVAVWVIPVMWVLVRAVGEYSSYAGLPMPIWVCFAVTVAANAVRLRHPRQVAAVA